MCSQPKGSGSLLGQSCRAVLGATELRGGAQWGIWVPYPLHLPTAALLLCFIHFYLKVIVFIYF